MSRRCYDGFGERHTAGMWARLLGVPRNTLWRCLMNGASVEEFANSRGIKFSSEIYVPKRGGSKLELSQYHLSELLKRSGYDPEYLKLSYVQGRQTHFVQYMDTDVGWFDYADGRLRLMNGEPLQILDPVVENPRILFIKEQWEIHPETKTRLFEKLHESRA